MIPTRCPVALVTSFLKHIKLCWGHVVFPVALVLKIEAIIHYRDRTWTTLYITYPSADMRGQCPSVNVYRSESRSSDTCPCGRSNNRDFFGRKNHGSTNQITKKRFAKWLKSLKHAVEQINMISVNQNKWKDFSSTMLSFVPLLKQIQIIIWPTSAQYFRSQFSRWILWESLRIRNVLVISS